MISWTRENLPDPALLLRPTEAQRVLEILLVDCTGHRELLVIIVLNIEQSDISLLVLINQIYSEKLDRRLPTCEILLAAERSHPLDVLAYREV